VGGAVSKERETGNRKRRGVHGIALRVKEREEISGGRNGVLKGRQITLLAQAAVRSEAFGMEVTYTIYG
jgi:hypothetical protein